MSTLLVSAHDIVIKKIYFKRFCFPKKATLFFKKG